MSPGRTMRAGLILTCTALVVAGTVSGCRPGRLELAVGAHRVTVTRPAGFEVVARDAALLFRDGAVLVELADLGAPGGDPGLDDPLEEWVDWGLRTLDSSSQRSVARRGTLHVQGREILVVETWDRLSHGQQRRFAFVLNRGSLLALHTRGGDFDRAKSAFDRVLRDLEFVDADPESRAGAQGPVTNSTASDKLVVWFDVLSGSRYQSCACITAPAPG